MAHYANQGGIGQSSWRNQRSRIVQNRISKPAKRTATQSIADRHPQYRVFAEGYKVFALNQTGSMKSVTAALDMAQVFAMDIDCASDDSDDGSSGDKSAAFTRKQTSKAAVQSVSAPSNRPTRPPNSSSSGSSSKSKTGSQTIHPDDPYAFLRVPLTQREHDEVNSYMPALRREIEEFGVMSHPY